MDLFRLPVPNGVGDAGRRGGLEAEAIVDCLESVDDAVVQRREVVGPMRVIPESGVKILALDAVVGKKRVV